MFASLVLLVAAQAPAATDFGVRVVAGSRPVLSTDLRPTPKQTGLAPAYSLAAAARIGARFGRVTSTWRSPARNRLVGGARNSWHLHGRAIDIARHASVRHSDIAAELRRNGLYLIESIDEGDHSHFAFAAGPLPLAKRRSASEQIAEAKGEANYFRFVTVPRSLRTTGAARGLHR